MVFKFGSPDLKRFELFLGFVAKSYPLEVRLRLVDSCARSLRKTLLCGKSLLFIRQRNIKRLSRQLEGLFVLDLCLAEQSGPVAFKASEFLMQYICGVLKATLEVGVAIDVEKLRQDVLTIFARRFKEFSEFALGKQNHLAELRTIEAEQITHSRIHIALLRCDRLAWIVDPCTRLKAQKCRRAPLFHKPFTATLLPALSWASLYPVPFLAQSKVERDACKPVRLRVMASQMCRRRDVASPGR